jgi:hypothetical protein
VDATLFPEGNAVRVVIDDVSKGWATFNGFVVVRVKPHEKEAREMWIGTLIWTPLKEIV